MDHGPAGALCSRLWRLDWVRFPRQHLTQGNDHNDDDDYDDDDDDDDDSVCVVISEDNDGDWEGPETRLGRKKKG